MAHKNSSPDTQLKVAYLFSRFPVISQTFCDTEMLALQEQGLSLVIGSINPPNDDFRHEHLAQLRAEQIYNPPNPVLRLLQQSAETRDRWPSQRVFRHQRDYGPEFKSDQRARNALYLAREFARRGVGHVHVHFTNRAAHTVLFLKDLTGIPFSVTAHAQDFMLDLGSDDLLREMIAESEFFIAVSDFSRKKLCEIAPDHAGKIHRIYNGMNLDKFPDPGVRPARETLKILSIGRLIEFKGFHKLIEACGLLRKRGQKNFSCEIIGEGPWHGRLQEQIETAGLRDYVRLSGNRSQEAVRAALAQADVFALASLVDDKGAMDILPTVILEAMAGGLPVVGTQLAGIPEMVEHSKTGLLVDPGDAQALADALGALLANPAWRGAYGNAGRERVEAVFDVRKTSGRLLTHFRASLEKSADDPRIRPADPPAPPRLVYLLTRPFHLPEQAPAFAEELLHLCDHPLRPHVIVSQEAAEDLKKLGDDPRFLPLLDHMTFLPPKTVLLGLTAENPEETTQALRIYDEANLPHPDKEEAAWFAALRHWLRITWQDNLFGAHFHVFDAPSLHLTVGLRSCGIASSVSLSLAHPKARAAVILADFEPEQPLPASVPSRWSTDPVHRGFLARHQRDRGFWKWVARLKIPSPRAQRAKTAPDLLREWADALDDYLNTR